MIVDPFFSVIPTYKEDYIYLKTDGLEFRKTNSNYQKIMKEEFLKSLKKKEIKTNI